MTYCDFPSNLVHLNFVDRNRRRNYLFGSYDQNLNKKVFPDKLLHLSFSSIFDNVISKDI